MGLTKRQLTLCACAGLLLACDEGRRVTGTWQVVTIDGVGPGAAAPIRAVFPAGAYGSDTLDADWMWSEYTLDSLVIDVLPGGSFHERLVERERTLVHKNTYVRPEYVSPAFGGDLIREPREAGRVDVTGSWSMVGDSILLSQPRDQMVGALVARVQDALPGTPAADIRAAVDAGVAAAPVRPRWRGMARGDRLELRDAAGRTYTFRRADPARY